MVWIHLVKALLFCTSRFSTFPWHSAGSLVAVNTYFEAPERVAALVLVAPAILTPLIAPKVVKENQSKMDTQTQWHGDDSNLNVQSNPFIRLCGILSKFSKYIVRAIMRLVKGMGEMFNSLYKKALSAVLRSAFAVMLVMIFLCFIPRYTWFKLGFVWNLGKEMEKNNFPPLG